LIRPYASSRAPWGGVRFFASPGSRPGLESIPVRAVLLIDDDADGRDAVAFVLEARGYRVAAAADGRSGIALARESRPDVVVLDMSLPGLDGWETTRRLRADPATRGAFIIALTGHATGEARQRALDAGVDGYLVKPCAPEDVIAEIERLEAQGPRS